MRRREFIALIGGATAAWPLAARAQQGGRMRRLGILMAGAESDPQYQADLAVFREGLQKLGQNIQVEVRWAGFDADTMRRYAKELIALQPDLILSNDTPTTATLLQQTRTVPIVFATVADPVGSGFVASFARPGGNTTGFAVYEASLGGKWLEVLKETVPNVSRVVVIFNPATAPFAEYHLKSINDAAMSVGVEVSVAHVHDVSLQTVVATQAREPNSGLIVLNEDFMIAHRVEIVSLAARYRLPAVYPFRFFAELGGLISYGVDLNDNFRRAVSYADRVLRGAKPSELPVQAPVKFELVINLKTAKAIGIDVPLQLKQRADEVIE
jgi:putative ABC transport system substrate-binding protein